MGLAINFCHGAYTQSFNFKDLFMCVYIYIYIYIGVGIYSISYKLF